VDYQDITEPSQLHAILDAVLTLEVDGELSDLLKRIVEQAATLVGARYGALGIMSPDGGHLVEFISVGLTEDERQRIGDPPVGKGLLGQVILEAEVVRADELATHPDRSGFPKGHPPMTTFLGVPVRIADKILGNLYLCDKRDNETFTEQDEALIDTLGRIAGLLIDKEQLRMRARAAEEDRLARLSPQERRILTLIAEGMTNRQIGEAMFLAEKTVKNYVSNVLAKLGFARRTEAAVFATRLHDHTDREGRDT
jgi:DNA-binding CsgD family transcriptional regulator